MSKTVPAVVHPVPALRCHGAKHAAKAANAVDSPPMNAARQMLIEPAK